MEEQHSLTDLFGVDFLNLSLLFVPIKWLHLLAMQAGDVTRIVLNGCSYGYDFKKGEK